MSEVIDAGTQVNTEAVIAESPDVAPVETPVETPVDTEAAPQPVDAPAEPIIPETYTIPDGSEVSQEALDDVSEVAKELKLDNDKALDLAKRLQNRDQELMKKVNTDALRANALIKQEIGDAAYTERINGAKQVFAQIEPLNEMLTDHPWLANDPKFIDGMSAIYKQFFAEDKTNLGENGDRPPAQKSAADKIFG